jgi:hypothetical protein
MARGAMAADDHGQVRVRRIEQIYSTSLAQAMKSRLTIT